MPSLTPPFPIDAVKVLVTLDSRVIDGDGRESLGVRGLRGILRGYVNPHECHPIVLARRQRDRLIAAQGALAAQGVEGAAQGSASLPRVTVANVTGSDQGRACHRDSSDVAGLTTTPDILAQKHRYRHPATGMSTPPATGRLDGGEGNEGEVLARSPVG